ncbi:MAG: hypothetical protein QGG40_16995, partial [Myxococcota bacterium]|nr:hypothetical protein [Myxococcota bacterium]
MVALALSLHSSAILAEGPPDGNGPPLRSLPSGLEPGGLPTPNPTGPPPQAARESGEEEERREPESQEEDQGGKPPVLPADVKIK